MGQRTYTDTPEPRYVERAKIADNAGEATPESIMNVIEGSNGVVADLNEQGNKVDIHIDMTGSGAGKVLTSDAQGNVSWSIVNQMPSHPEEDGTYKLRCIVLDGVATYSWVSE